MRYLVKIPVPQAAAQAPGFDEQLNTLFAQLKAQANYSTGTDGWRIDYMVVEIGHPARMAQIAEPLFRLTGAKVEFLPEVMPTPFFGRKP